MAEQSGFEIEVQPDGKCDVVRDRRAFWYDCGDLEEALDRIRSQHGRGLEVIVIESDGYRVRATT